MKRHLDVGELMPQHRAAPMTLLYPHRQHLSRRLQLFADWLAALLKEQLRVAG
ncbi:DNA-binding transcriptional LysR family regulator [Bradyrhizobium sp. USDA 4011]